MGTREPDDSLSIDEIEKAIELAEFSRGKYMISIGSALEVPFQADAETTHRAAMSLIKQRLGISE